MQLKKFRHFYFLIVVFVLLSFREDRLLQLQLNSSIALSKP